MSSKGLVIKCVIQIKLREISTDDPDNGSALDLSASASEPGIPPRDTRPTDRTAFSKPNIRSESPKTGAQNRRTRLNIPTLKACRRFVFNHIRYYDLMDNLDRCEWHFLFSAFSGDEGVGGCDWDSYSCRAWLTIRQVRPPCLLPLLVGANRNKK